MKSPLQSTARGRFIAGFCVAGFFSFGGILFMTRGREFGTDFLAACIAAPIIGLFVGLLAALWKPLYDFFAAFFKSMPW